MALFRAAPDDVVEALSSGAAVVEDIEQLQYVVLREGTAFSAVRERRPVLSDLFADGPGVAPRPRPRTRWSGGVTSMLLETQPVRNKSAVRR
ncbi:hypothetical protein [Mycolicibacterium helvum]|uniref:hypothetical protein n=1 Tax=Mycolicibacterium helvum TaxID=1534349 RepID=UPI0013D07D51|nr:hypothetical protein [Mycolicibacterium helvum]